MEQHQLEKKLKANIPKLYTYSFFQMFLVIVPVIVPFWQLKGLSLQQIFTLQAVFGGALLLFDLPAGYIADLFGRKRTMVLGSIISALGFQLLWMGETFYDFVIYEFILGLGLSLQSGCDVALLYSTLDKQGKLNRGVNYLGRRLTTISIGEGIASLLGGALAAWSMQWPAYLNAITPWFCVLAALSIYEPTNERMCRKSHKENFKYIARSLLGHSKYLRWILSNFIFYGFATYCAVWSLQPYWQSLGLTVSVFGYLWAGNNFVVALVGSYAQRIEQKLGSKSTFILIALLPIIGYLGMGVSGGLFGLLFTLAFPVCRGLNQVLFQHAINARIPQNMRATVNSVGGLGVRMLFIVFGPLLGYTMDHHGPKNSFFVLAGVYLVGLFVVAIPLHRQMKLEINSEPSA